MKPCSTKNHIFVIAIGVSNILVVSTNLMGIQVFFSLFLAQLLVHFTVLLDERKRGWNSCSMRIYICISARGEIGYHVGCFH